MNPLLKHLAALTGIAIVVAILLSVLFSVPYIYTALGFTGWTFFGHLVQFDDDLPGGWSNLDGEHPVPIAEITIKGAVFLGVLTIAWVYPEIKQLGR